RLLPIYRGNPAKPMVSLMINVAWGDEYLMPMLDTLKAANVHASNTSNKQIAIANALADLFVAFMLSLTPILSRYPA
ncbi:MAG: hypothetical protein J7559_22015, partial [Cohnella sp.]|nr:hypothetical protein [Cohnella sp.]